MPPPPPKNLAPITIRPAGAAASIGIEDLEPSVRSADGLSAVGAMPMSRYTCGESREGRKMLEASDMRASRGAE